ncbi:ycf49-like protein [Dioscorea cayenensis subsp. rotundata]|uniref:Ycf49-like protein n=1 Tax=Dioscorea cayennensis subsp. rotundata TaxID=55577 RepID=A0AB40CAR5_DIOCR|nr:ycf49-like protein [Dioscorea cayenensis subsp. rotundata]
MAASCYLRYFSPLNVASPPRFSPTFHSRSSSKPYASSPSRTASAVLIAAGAGLALSLPSVASAAMQEPANALSLPTWIIHISSVVEWITAMVLVWEYGEKSGFEAWKGLSWGMVPLLGGAMCACTWHFFYNSESLDILVALQGMLTVVGNLTMCIAAYRIFKSAQGSS